jgi:RNA polymerase sigma factor (sigma-70 family)
MASDPDLELLRGWTRGDRSCAGDLVRRHRTAVHDFVRRRLSGDLDDVVHETFLVCLEKAAGFRGESSVRTFLLGIAKRQCQVEGRRRAKLKRVAVSAMDLDTRPPVAEAVDDLEGALVDLENALADARIPDDLRTVLELTFWRGLTRDQAAKMLGTPSGTVASRIRRAKEKLRDLVKSLGEDASSGSEL